MTHSSSSKIINVPLFFCVYKRGFWNAWGFFFLFHLFKLAASKFHLSLSCWQQPGDPCLEARDSQRNNPQKDIQTKAGLLGVKPVITFPSKCRFDMAAVLGMLPSLHSLPQRERRRSFTCSSSRNLKFFFFFFFFLRAACSWCRLIWLCKFAAGQKEKK